MPHFLLAINLASWHSWQQTCFKKKFDKKDGNTVCLKNISMYGNTRHTPEKTLAPLALQRLNQAMQDLLPESLGTFHQDKLKAEATIAMIQLYHE